MRVDIRIEMEGMEGMENDGQCIEWGAEVRPNGGWTTLRVKDKIIIQLSPELLSPSALEESWGSFKHLVMTAVQIPLKEIERYCYSFVPVPKVKGD